MKTHIIGWYVMRLKHILNLSWRTSGTEHTSISPVYLQTGGLHVALLYHGMQQRFLQGSLWLTNYSLKWKCSYSLMKLSAQIRHKSHSVLFCPLNHYSVWVPGFCVLSKHANMFFFILFVLWKTFENMKLPEVFHCPSKLCKLKTCLFAGMPTEQSHLLDSVEFMHAHGSDLHTIQTFNANQQE